MTALKPNLWHDKGQWRPHKGGDCPIPRDAMVMFQFACGQTSSEPRRAGNYIWRRRSEPFDVVAYKVISGADEQSDAPAWTPTSGGY